MNVRGVAFLAREALFGKERGAAAWRQFLADYALKDPFFAQPITPLTLIPAEPFLAFNDALVARFPTPGVEPYWRLGEMSAEWALTQGQNKGLFQPGEYRRFMFAGSAIYSTYFDSGTYRTVNGGDFTDAIITELPVHHPYFELSIMGYLHRGLELLGAHDIRRERLAGFTRGDGHVHYRFRVT